MSFPPFSSVTQTPPNNAPEISTKSDQKQVLVLLVAGFLPSVVALIASLAWNSLFIEIFTRLSPKRQLAALVFYALFVTVLAVVFGYIFFDINRKGKLSGSPKLSAD